MIVHSSLLLLVVEPKRMLAFLDQTWLLVPKLASANRALLLLVFVGTESHHVALAAAAPVVSASRGFLGNGHIDILRKARISCVVVCHDVALTWSAKLVQFLQRA
jgi:hypothetical protein